MRRQPKVRSRRRSEGPLDKSLRDGWLFVRRMGVNRERMHATVEFRRKQLIYQAVAVDTGLAFERVRHDINPEMCLSTFPVSGVTRVLM